MEFNFSVTLLEIISYGLAAHLELPSLRTAVVTSLET